jgi:hypothetical protein
MSKQDRQGVRTASDLERKYQFDKQFAEIMGINLDTQKSVEELGSNLRNEIQEQSTSMTRTAEAMIITALEKYVETEDLEEFRKTIQTELGVWADGIVGRVTATEEAVNAVDSDLQDKFNTITKYFTFTIDGLTIGQVDNPYKIVIDNDDITIYSGENVVQTFKADGTALIPSLTVTKEASLVGMKIINSATHLDFEYVGVE